MIPENVTLFLIDMNYELSFSWKWNYHTYIERNNKCELDGILYRNLFYMQIHVAFFLIGSV